jgi:hypothetical protein
MRYLVTSNCAKDKEVLFLPRGFHRQKNCKFVHMCMMTLLQGILFDLPAQNSTVFVLVHMYVFICL